MMAMSAQLPVSVGLGTQVSLFCSIPRILDECLYFLHRLSCPLVWALCNVDVC